MRLVRRTLLGLIVVLFALAPRLSHLLPLAVAAGGAPQPGSGPVDIKGFVRIIDGDTADVWLNHNEVGIHALGIATPQGNTACGRAATAQLQSLVKGGLHLDEDASLSFDKRTRRLYYWSTPDGRDIAMLMVQAGLVRADGTGKEAAALKVAQDTAKAAKTGCLWDGTPNAETPSKAPPKSVAPAVSPQSGPTTSIANPATSAVSSPLQQARQELSANAPAPTSAAAATTLPSGFTQDVIVNGLNYPTSFAFVPDGRIFATEKAGTIRVFKNGALLPTPLVDLTSEINDYWDHGLLAMAIDPNFASNGYIYVMYTYEDNAANYSGTKTARLARLTVSGDTASPASETVLVGTVVGSTCQNYPDGTDCIPSDAVTHSVGMLRFAPDGTIFATLGDGASFTVVDPLALRAQDLDSLGGKMIHITTAGKGIASNPFYDGNGSDNRSKVWAYGLRNSYRFGLRPGTGLPYLGDVGWNTWEEINAVPSGADLGWPCYEGDYVQAGYQPLSGCQTLYAKGTSAVTFPVISWGHNGGSSAATGGIFYTGTAFPAQYQGAYFYGDYGQSWIHSLQVDSNNKLVPGSDALFGSGADGPVFFEMGPDQNLYYLSIATGQIRRIRYSNGNTPPTAAATATPSSGLAPLAVQFAANAIDPDGDTLTYDWDFGDGSAHGTTASPQHTYTTNGTYTAKLTVTDTAAQTASGAVSVVVGATPPVVTISSPVSTLQYKVGDTINFVGSATDRQDGTLGGSALTWNIIIHHCPGGQCHIHPFMTVTGASGSFVVPDHGDQSYFELDLTATDSKGLTATSSVTIQPQPVQLTLDTSPTGLQVVYDGTAYTAPLVRSSIVNSVHTIGAPTPQGAEGFSSWSDGGAAQHNITLGATATSLVATFAPTGATAPTVTAINPAAGLVSGGTTVTITGTGFSTAAGSTAIAFGGIAATNVSCSSTTTCTAVSPPGNGGVDVQATVKGVTSIAGPADVFSYLYAPGVSGVSPQNGPAGGGTKVTITGFAFSTVVGGTTFKFGGALATSVSCASSTQCTAVTPAGTSVVDVTATVAGATSATGTADTFLYGTLPTVTAVSPAKGSTAGGTSVTVTGTGFNPPAGGIYVVFGGYYAAISSCASATQCTAISPPGAAGTVDVQISLAGVLSLPVAADKFTYGTAPAVTGIAPASGPAAGGTVVTITGTGFSTTAGATTVKFGATAATKVSCASTTQCTATSPKGGGTQDVLVTVGGFVSSVATADQFAYPACTNANLTFSPVSPIPGGATVKLTGSATCSGTAQYKFLMLAPGGSWTIVQNYGSATTYTWNTAGLAQGEYWFSTFVHTAGSELDPESSIYVPFLIDSSPCGAANVTATPASPQPAGAAVTLTASGTCPTGTPEYQLWLEPPNGQWSVLGGYQAGPTFSWNTAGLAPGTYWFMIYLRKQGFNGDYESRAYVPFQVNASAGPTVTGISPNSGPLAGGTAVTVTGTGFSTTAGATTIAFAGMAGANTSCASTTQCVSTSPAGAGVVDVTATVNGLTSALVPADKFTYTAAPAVTGIAPASGPAAGGTVVTITGTNFSTTAGATSVKFGASAAASVSCAAATRCTATSPAGGGTQDVTVTVNGQTSAAVPADEFAYPPCANAGLSFTPASPHASGVTVTVTGSATCNGTPQYEFIVLPPGGVWTVVQNYGASATYAWNTTGLADGEYWFGVYARTAGSVSDPETRAYVAYMVDGSPCVNPNLTAAPASSQQAGTAITLTASGNCPTGTPQYQLWLQPPGGAWAVLDDYQASPTFAWNTTSLTPGTYWFLLYLRKQGFNGDYEGYVYLPFTLTAALGNVPAVTAISPTSGPAAGGTVVTITGTNFSTTAGATSVKFGASAATGVSCAAASQCTATSPAGGGTQDVTVTVGGQTSATSVADQFSYPGCTNAQVAFAPASPQAAGPSITVTGSASCPAAAQYEFLLATPGSTQYSVLQEFGSSATYAWNTSGLAEGEYWLAVFVRSTGSQSAFETRVYAAYLIDAQPCTGAALSASPASPQSAGTTMTLTASGSCPAGTAQYKLQIQPPGGAWAVLGDYQAGSSFTWNTAGLAPGTYWFLLYLRKQGFNGDYEGYVYMPFTLQ